MFVAAGAATLVAGGAIAVLGPTGPWIVDQVADGQRVWRLGRLNIEGVTGTGLGEMSARRVTLADEAGVWVEIENVALRWRPLDLLWGDVRIDAAGAERIHVLRRPQLTPATPGGPAPDVYLTALNVARVDLEAPVAEVPGSFKLDLGFTLEDQRIRLVDLLFARLDNAADSARVQFTETADALTMNAEIVGAPGGVFAHFMGSESETVRILANGQGDLNGGEIVATGRTGEARLLDARLDWRGNAWRLAATGNLPSAPFFSPIVERVGSEIALSGEGERDGAATLNLRGPNLTATLVASDTEGFALAGPAQITAESPRLARLAPEFQVGGGATRVEANVTQRGNDTVIEGQLSVTDANAGGLLLDLSGPGRVRLNVEHILFDGDLAIGPDAMDVFDGATVALDIDFDRQRTRFGLNRARIEGPSVLATASGWAANNDGEFSGEWRVKRAQAVMPPLQGSAQGAWRARADAARGWIVTANGAAQGLRGEPAYMPELLGAAPTLDMQLAINEGVVNVSHARVNGAKLRAGATGRIRDGNADLALEASARGPINLGAAIVEGNADATGRLTGDIARPRIDTTVHLASADVSGVRVDAPVVTLSIAPSGNTYRGTVTAEGQVNGQAARATSDIAIDNAGMSFPTLVADLGALHATGDARFANAGPTANLQLSGALDNLMPGAAGRVQGTMAVTPNNVAIEASLADARLGDLRMRTATVSASGPFDNIAARFSLRGALNRATLVFDGTGALTTERNNVTNVRIEGQGALAGAPLRLTTPATARFARGVMEASLDATIADGRLQLDWRDTGRALRADATMENAPIAPIVAVWGEEGQGRMSGRAHLENSGGGLAGSMDVAVDGARFARRTGETLDGRFVANLSRDRLTANIDARSSDGLVARFEADAPVTTDAAPIRIALAPDRQGRASWSVRGPLGGLWTAARLNDQILRGDVNGEGTIRFGAGSLTGEGDITLANGAFEDKLSGVKLQAIDARIAFGPNGAQIERFAAQDSRGGRITATGGAANPQQGRIAINLSELRLVDRPDARAVASGDIALEWQGTRSSLTGDINIREGQVSLAGSAASVVPQLDVIEINRPGVDDEPIQPVIGAPRGEATTLDIRVRAPGRIFTRGRGIEAEWSLDLRLAGNAANPRLFGEARTIRGDLALSGRPFEITAGRIAFNGDPLEAMIDITAERDTPELTARLHLTGTANDPEIAFSSTPALPEDEILPQVLFGRSVEDLSPLEAAQLASSLAALSGQASFDLAEAARAVSGLDRLDVRQDDGGGLLVAGGVYLTRDVYLEIARTGLGEAQTRVEWRVRPQLLLVTSFLPNGDQRASVRWRTER